MKKLRQLLSMLLALTLVVTSFATNVLADGPAFELTQTELTHNSASFSFNKVSERSYTAKLNGSSVTVGDGVIELTGLVAETAYTLEITEVLSSFTSDLRGLINVTGQGQNREYFYISSEGVRYTFESDELEANGNDTERRLKVQRTFSTEIKHTTTFTTLVAPVIPVLPVTNATITITADDAYDLYFNGEFLGTDNNWRDVESFRVNIGETFTIAVKAWDNHQVIAGLSVVINFDDEERADIYTNNSSGWILTTETPGAGWNQAGYDVTGWKKVTNVSDGRWNTEPVLGRQWVWTDNYVYSNNFDTPVYFRLDPLTPYIAPPVENHTLTLTYMQMARDPEALRTYRVFHKDLTNYGYDVKLGYRIAGNEGITALEPKLVYATHTEGNRNTEGLQYLFTTGNKVGVDESETVILYWWNAAQEQWIQSQTKASSTLYSITYDANGGTLAEGESVKYAYTNDSITAPVPTRSGYSFDGWVYTPESFNPASVKSSATAIAQWTEDESEQPENPVIIVQPTISTFASVTNYSLTVNIEGEGTVPGYTGTSNFSSGTNVNLDPKPEEGFVFLGWEGDTETMTGNTIVMNGNKVITAVFGTLADDELELGDQEIAQAAPEEEADEETTDTQEESQPVVDESEVTILDGKAPQATATEETELPKTGGIPLEGLVFAGTALIGLGRKLRKR